MEGFVKWLLNQGYSLASVNNRLSAIKVYARPAAKVGVIPPTEQALIREMRGYGRTEGKQVDEIRPKTRVGNKKEEAIVLTAVQARQLKTTDTMELSSDIWQALTAYAPYLRQSGILLRGNRKNNKLTDDVMSVRAIGSRIKILGRDILELWELSPHDLRHTWATRAAKGSNPFVLRDAGGWTNMQTSSRYVERAKVVNEGIKLDY
ncbi:MAG: tyrosine-type recombinase/integrase [Anaerolineae bacterium]|nr:tyrosine-type recombinase/integrase [Anaerolineae bacterium]